jgi:hypothetical protein
MKQKKKVKTKPEETSIQSESSTHIIVAIIITKVLQTWSQKVILRLSIIPERKMRVLGTRVKNQRVIMANEK